MPHNSKIIGSITNKIKISFLIVAGILYAAIFENKKTLVFAPEKIRQLNNRLTDFYPKGESLKDIIGIYSVEDRESFLYHDMKDEHLVCTL